jgi:hypothetical protein
MPAVWLRGGPPGKENEVMIYKSTILGKLLYIFETVRIRIRIINSPDPYQSEKSDPDRYQSERPDPY